MPLAPASRRLGAAVTLAALAVLSAPSAATAACARGPAATVVTYSTAGTHTFTVPASIVRVCLEVQGAPGGAGVGGAGGAGGLVQGTLAVTPGDTLVAVVGGPGVNGGAGANGGGAPGSSGGGGGGASDVRTAGGTLADRIVVAGGGGGAAQTSINGGGGGTQVDGGGSGGGTGTGQVGSTGSATAGGRGGNASGSANFGGGGGGGGAGGGGGGGANSNAAGGSGGTAGQVGSGGSGSCAAGGGTLSAGGASACLRGGGGGGGYRGGGAGGIRGGGGGGSSWTHASLTAAAMSAGSGAASVTIVYAPPAPGFSAAPTAQGYGAVRVGTDASATVTVTNTGDLDLAISAVSIMGADAAQFALGATDTCAGATVPPSSTCAVSVRYAPGAAGSHAATLSFADDAGNPDTVALTGTGIDPGFAAAPGSPHAYGAHAVGTSTGQTFTITNDGTSPLVIGTVALTDPDGQFDLGADTCSSASVAVSGTCSVTVAYEPTLGGPRTATLAFPSNTGGSEAIVLTGTGTAPAFNASPVSHAFGPTLVGAATATTITVTNAGDADLVISAVSVAGTDAANFAVGPTDSCSGTTVAPAATCQVAVRYAPSAAGAHAASLSFADNTGAPDAVALAGTANDPGFAASPASPFAFGARAVGTSTAQTFTIANDGATPLVIGTVTLTLSAPAGSFRRDTDTCSGQAVAPSASCTVVVAYEPTVGGVHGAMLDFPTNTGAPEVVALSGTGLAPALGIAPAGPYAFGSQDVGTSTARSFTVTNTGAAPLTLGTPTLAGPPSFMLDTTCAGAVLAPEASCTGTVRFAPAAAGSAAATLTLPHDAGGPAIVELAGTGLEVVAPPVPPPPPTPPTPPAEQRAAPADWPVPLPSWFWDWASWHLALAAGERAGARPASAPRLVPEWAWHRIAVMQGAAPVRVPARPRDAWPTPLPSWFWPWARWYALKPDPDTRRRPARRPPGAPAVIPDWAWDRYARWHG